MKISWKNYAISALTVLIVLSAFFLLKLYIIPTPASCGHVLAIDLRSLMYSLVAGIAVNIVLHLVNKPILRIAVAGAAIFSSLFFDDSLFTTVYFFAMLCLLGSIPFIASMIDRIGQKI